MDDDAFLSVQGIGHAPWRITQMVARLGAAWAKTAHHTGQSLGPVAGSERVTAGGHAEDDDFVGVVAVHKIILEACGFRLLTMIPP